MEYRRFDNTIVARFEQGEEIHAQLKEICIRENVKLANISALGAVSRFTVGAYDLGEKKYISNTFTGTYEIVSLTGSVNTMNGEYYAHLHMACSDEKGVTVGGHLNEGIISATCEMFIFILNGEVDRYRDEEIGINLLDFR